MKKSPPTPTTPAAPAPPEREAAGVACPSCACPHAPVLWTRAKPWGRVRRRECRACQKQFTTVEKFQ